MPRIHDTVSGQRIEYPDPTPELERFLKRVQASVDDPRQTPDDLITLIYGNENPILERGVAPGRGLVTAAVIANPVYHVLADLLGRKQFAATKTDPAKVAAKFTLTVAEAAERKGVSPEAIRKAVRERRIPHWVKDGSAFFDPKRLDAVELGKRGPTPEGTEPLAYKAGWLADQDVFLKLRAPGVESSERVSKDGISVEGFVPRWRRAGVLTGGHQRLRFFEIEPATTEETIPFHDFFVRGKFRIVRKVNNRQEARKAWAEFKAVR